MSKITMNQVKEMYEQQQKTIEEQQKTIEEMNNKITALTNEIEGLKNRKGKNTIINITKPHHIDLMEGQRIKHVIKGYSAYFGTMRFGKIVSDDNKEYDSLNKFALYHYKKEDMENFPNGNKRTCNAWAACETEMTNGSWIKLVTFRDSKDHIKDKIKIYDNQVSIVEDSEEESILEDSDEENILEDTDENDIMKTYK